MEAAVQSTFVLEDFQLDHIAVSKKLDERTAVALGGDNLFQINSNGNRVGYVYLGQAPSMKNVFDYVVLFNPDMSIKKSKVLIYREDYGRQIGSQRWLKQFIGKTSGDPLDYGKNIDAISGATISAKSMTKAVQEVLSSMAILKAASIL
ncbi:MAG: FMN-binding protein [Bacteroidota bacterium]